MKTHFHSRALPQSGFTLLEVMVVAGILGVVVAIAVAGISRPRASAQTAVCQNNLKQIEAAKQQWATENGKKEEDAPEMWQLTSYFKQIPECPSGGTYSVNDCRTPASCTSIGHTL